VGRVIGRPLDHNDEPIANTMRQEDYLESRFEIPIDHQEQLAAVATEAVGERFRIPSNFARALVIHAFLGQLDVNPMGGVPGSQNDRRWWKFSGERVPSADSTITRVRIEGESHVEGGQENGRSRGTDGRMWQHRVTLAWQGYVDIQNNRVIELVMLAEGTERLRWGNAYFDLAAESDVEHLMAGHAIDLDCNVRYGLIAQPAATDEIVGR
jgi:hypothetical protein